jgi:ribosomal protein S6
MKNYELLYILPLSMSGKEIRSSFLEIEKNIKKMKGEMLETLIEHPFLIKTEVSKEEESEELKDLPIIKRKMAYPIKKNRFGFYCLVNFSSEPKNIKEIDNYLKMNNEVLRHIIIQEDPMSKENLEQLQKLFARKKAEEEKKERKEKESDNKKEESKKIALKKKEEETKTETIKEGTKKDEKKEKKEEIEKTSKEEKEKTTKKKSKIKLEDLESKLDEILEDTII